MNGWQRKFALAALWLIAVGILGGLWHAAAVRYSSALVLHSGARWTAADLASRNSPQQFVEAAEHRSYTLTRVVDAHTHIIKLATLLLLIALLYPLVDLPEKRKTALSALFLTGTCVFPLGVLAEIIVGGRVGQPIAAAGALLVIVSFAGVGWGVLIGSRNRA